MTLKQTHFTRQRGSAPEPTPAPRVIPPRLRVAGTYEVVATSDGAVVRGGGLREAWHATREAAEGFAGRCRR
jgi:hypothetical protein